MKGITFHSIIKTFALLVLLFCANVLFAQPGPPGGGQTPNCWPPPCIPIDGGIGFLVAAGVALGIKKTIDVKRKKKEEA